MLYAKVSKFKIEQLFGGRLPLGLATVNKRQVQLQIYGVT